MHSPVTLAKTLALIEEEKVWYLAFSTHNRNPRRASVCFSFLICGYGESVAEIEELQAQSWWITTSQIKPILPLPGPNWVEAQENKANSHSSMAIGLVAIKILTNPLAMATPPYLEIQRLTIKNRSGLVAIDNPTVTVIIGNLRRRLSHHGR
ncbi:hypothetical protein NL676_014315 [Syzygium grande]|nr:hypothetical protein NL676_014315 [Syzygium grande]